MSYRYSYSSDILSGLSDTKIIELLELCSKLPSSINDSCHGCSLEFNAVYDGSYTCIDVLMLEASNRLQKYVDKVK